MGSMQWAMNWIHTSVLATYLIGISMFGIGVGFRKNASSEQCFLAHKSPAWFTIDAGVIPSNITPVHLAGLAASGAKDGMVVDNFEWMASSTLDLDAG